METQTDAPRDLLTAGADDETDASRLAAALDDPSPADPDDAPAPSDEPRRPSGRLLIGDETKGRYVVLWARKPAKGEDARPTFQEVDVVAASGPEAAKRAVLTDDAPFAAFLKHSAAQKPGILLRAVPAMHWPDTIKPTTYVTPDPVLTVG